MIMATSNDTLYGLAAHLQTMENNLTDFIFHCALRLSTMTDSRVFVLMENPNDGGGGRRFCGNSSLIEEFSSRGLHLRRGADVEMELNPGSSPVRQKPQPQRESLQLQPPELQSLVAGGTKRRASANATPIDYDSAKKSRRDEEASVKENGQDPSAMLECKAEVEEYLIDSDSNDETTAGNEASFGNATSNGSSSYLDSFDGSLLAAAANTMESSSSSSTLTFAVGDGEDTPSRRIGLNVPNLMAKERAVAQIDNPSQAFIRGSMENKLLASICYDAGKALTMSNPHPVESPLFRDHCRERIHAYVEQFPHFLSVPVTLEATALLSRENETQQYTPESFMKMNARNGQKRALKAMQKAGVGCG